MSFDRSVEIDQISLAQHGLVTTEQAIAALGPSRKHRWVQQGRLISMQPSVYRLLGAPDTWHQQLKAAELSSGGVVSHRSAAEIWGLMQPAGYIEVSIPGDLKRAIRPPAVVRRIKDLHPDLAVERAGLRLTDPVRTVIDLGLVTPGWNVRRAIATGMTAVC